MKILIVEDQEEKSDDLVTFFNSNYSQSPDICIKQSLRSGLRALTMQKDYDLVILDMSMPNFDPSADDPIGGTPESFAGKELLSQMELREISIPVVVVTQYATFSKGQISLDDLDLNFKHTYPGFYLGAVYYSSASESWKGKLRLLINDL